MVASPQIRLINELDPNAPMHDITASTSLMASSRAVWSKMSPDTHSTCARDSARCAGDVLGGPDLLRLRTSMPLAAARAQTF